MWKSSKERELKESEERKRLVSLVVLKLSDFVNYILRSCFWDLVPLLEAFCVIYETYVSFTFALWLFMAEKAY